MCRFPWFYGPMVPGALAPVIAPKEWTQPVGVRNCRLYTAPTGGGVVDAGYFQAKNTEELDSNPYTFTNMNASIADPTGKITVQNGIVTVGAGVSVIGISVSCGIPSAQHSTYYGVSILKNSVVVGSCMRITGTTTGPMQSDSFSIPLTLVNVSEGDEIQFRVSGGNGEYCTMETNIIVIK